jgi:hypothetical protein
MKRIFAVGLFALFSIVPASNTPAEENDPLAIAPTQYTADMVVTHKTGPPMTMHVYVDGNKRREDRDVHGGIINILRGDLDKRYMLTVSSKLYVEGRLNPRMVQSSSDWGKQMGLLPEKLGTEEVNGELCDKYRYDTDKIKTPIPLLRRHGPMSRHPVNGFIWVGQSTHMIVKSETPAMTTEWKNIKLGPPDASVFELPADYKKAEPRQPAQIKPEEEKSGDDSPSPAPSPNGEKPDQQKSDSGKSGADKSGDQNKS